MNLPKLYRTVTMEIESDSWSSMSGEWEQTTYQHRFSARRVLQGNNWEWQIVEDGEINDIEIIKDWLDSKYEMINCIVTGQVYNKDIIYSGCWETIKQKNESRNFSTFPILF